MKNIRVYLAISAVYAPGISNKHEGSTASDNLEKGKVGTELPAVSVHIGNGVNHPRSVDPSPTACTPSFTKVSTHWVQSNTPFNYTSFGRQLGNTNQFGVVISPDDLWGLAIPMVGEKGSVFFRGDKNVTVSSSINTNGLFIDLTDVLGLGNSKIVYESKLKELVMDMISGSYGGSKIFISYIQSGDHHGIPSLEKFLERVSAILFPDVSSEQKLLIADKLSGVIGLYVDIPETSMTDSYRNILRGQFITNNFDVFIKVEVVQGNVRWMQALDRVISDGFSGVIFSGQYTEVPDFLSILEDKLRLSNAVRFTSNIHFLVPIGQTRSSVECFLESLKRSESTLFSFPRGSHPRLLLDDFKHFPCLGNHRVCIPKVPMDVSSPLSTVDVTSISLEKCYILTVGSSDIQEVLVKFRSGSTRDLHRKHEDKCLPIAGSTESLNTSINVIQNLCPEIFVDLTTILATDNFHRSLSDTVESLVELIKHQMANFTNPRIFLRFSRVKEGTQINSVKFSNNLIVLLVAVKNKVDVNLGSILGVQFDFPTGSAEELFFRVSKYADELSNILGSTDLIEISVPVSSSSFHLSDQNISTKLQMILRGKTGMTGSVMLPVILAENGLPLTTLTGLGFHTVHVEIYGGDVTHVGSEEVDSTLHGIRSILEKQMAHIEVSTVNTPLFKLNLNLVHVNLC